MALCVCVCVSIYIIRKKESHIHWLSEKYVNCIIQNTCLASTKDLYY